jgi:hypothetical protein
MEGKWGMVYHRRGIAQKKKGRLSQLFLTLADVTSFLLHECADVHLPGTAELVSSSSTEILVSANFCGFLDISAGAVEQFDHITSLYCNAVAAC